MYEHACRPMALNQLFYIFSVFTEFYVSICHKQGVWIWMGLFSDPMGTISGGFKNERFGGCGISAQ